MAIWEVHGRDEASGKAIVTPLMVRGATDQEAVREAARRGVVADDVRRLSEDGRNGKGSGKAEEALLVREEAEADTAGMGEEPAEADEAADMIADIASMRAILDRVRDNALVRAPIAVCIVAVLSGWMAQWLRESAAEAGWLRECDAVIFFVFLGFCFFAARGGRAVAGNPRAGDPPRRMRKPR